MTDQDRGAYTPHADAPLSFDARQSRDGRRPVPMTLILSGLVLAVLVVALVLFYRSGVRHAGDQPQPVGAPVASMKSAAPPSAQPSEPTAGLQVYNDNGTPQAAAPNFAPPPEQPMARPAPAPVVPAAQPTTPIQAQPLRPAQTAAAEPPAAPPAAKPAPATAAATPPVKTAEAAPKPATAAATPAKTAAPAAKPASGASVVQIGAFSSAALADKGWNDVAKVLPGQMAGKTKRVETIDKDGSTFYRTFVGGFANHADAVAFCESLKFVGKTCIVKG
ncbi:sporulation protein [Caulobacter sp. CCUG 60055]|uniref:cell division protein FtsN n=1 Tax=Caulobacter sp. CCUG 60055 TaxID=2100090 RepID=UPI001FA752D0|nr:SPOR domain-containing protein [Caulobacter sp. CCUG 60055]MBQ1540927.1 SPOR domain-containing protein [Caulobacteraceae bacterium]MCI3179165.1 sporulation protein [Caulobacter sp. CCUG 60055]